jgi:hypothetical protein
MGYDGYRGYISFLLDSHGGDKEIRHRKLAIELERKINELLKEYEEIIPFPMSTNFDFSDPEP